jgi:hypothetical protein
MFDARVNGVKECWEFVTVVATENDRWGDDLFGRQTLPYFSLPCEELGSKKHRPREVEHRQRWQLTQSWNLLDGRVVRSPILLFFI